MKVADEELSKRLERFHARAREKGVKMTHQRLEIFKEVAASLEHPDVETIYKALRPRMPTVSVDTVYRTLWLLNELGLVDTLGPKRESVRFDPNVEPHHHYVCVRCGLTRDIAEGELVGLELPDSVKSLGSVVSRHVELRGVCRNCAGEAAGK